MSEDLATKEHAPHGTRQTSPEDTGHDQALGLRLRRFVLSETHAAAAQLGLPGEDRHQGIHQARKRIRRVRAVLALGRATLGEPGRRLDKELGRLCRGLSPLRDSQALIEGLERIAPAGAWPEAIQLARQRRNLQLQAALARDPEFGRRRERLQRLALRLERLDWAAVDKASVTAAVKRSERRLQRSQRRAQRQPADEERWHVMRRRFRRLRQQDNVLAQEEPGLRPARAVSADDATALGEAQDDALILRSCGRYSPFPPTLRRSLRQVVRERLGRARRHAVSSPL